MDDDWEELDESAMEECMVLATQLCSQQPPKCNSSTSAQKSIEASNIQCQNRLKEMENGKQFCMSNNKDMENANESGVWSTRSSNFHPSGSNSLRNSSNDLSSKSNTIPQKKGMPQCSYRSRFSDFSTSTKVPSGHHGSLTRNLSSSGKSLANTKSNSSKLKNLSDTSSENGAEENAFISHHIEETKQLNEKIITMQGEISLLRAELKRKDTSLEAERIDHCAAVEAAEKRGREKIAKKAADAESKLKEMENQVEKFQGELVFKKREIEELLNRCHQLEQQSHSSQVPEPPSKRQKLQKTSTDVFSRLDFGLRGSAKVCNVEVQTETIECYRNTRTRLDVALPQGLVSERRRIATLLSSCAQSTPFPSSSMLHVDHPGISSSCSLSSEWLTPISQALRKNESDVEQKLVTLAVEQLLQTQQTIQDDNLHENRLALIHDDPAKWYENKILPAIQIILHFNSSSEPRTVKAVAVHLKPLHIKNVVVNRRICIKLLEAAELALKNVKYPLEKTDCDVLSPLFRECCGSIESDSEAKILLRIASILILNSQLCCATGTCLIGQLCRKVKKLCVADLKTLRILLCLTSSVVKVAPASSCLTSPCTCSSQLLGTLLWHMYQVLESSYLSTDKKKMTSMMVSGIQLLHHWSIVDPQYWDKVSHFSQYPVFMVTLANKAKDVQFGKNTVDLLCDLFEFEEGTFER